jgi:hypothetical protein
MRGSHTLGIFLQIDCDPALRVWMGVNDIPVGFDSITGNGIVFLGGGRLLNVPTLEVLVNGQADSVEFGLSGVDFVGCSLPMRRGPGECAALIPPLLPRRKGAGSELKFRNDYGGLSQGAGA